MRPHTLHATSVATVILLVKRTKRYRRWPLTGTTHVRIGVDGPAWDCVARVRRRWWILFPDHPTANTPPHEDVLRFVRCRSELWGKPYQYIAANTSERGSYDKDVLLLRRNDVYARAALPVSPEHFLACHGPEDKARQLELVSDRVRRTGCRYLQAAIYDDSALVLKHIPRWVHRIGYQIKDRHLAGMSAWLSAPPPRTYLLATVSEVATVTARLHVAAIREALGDLQLAMSVTSLLLEEAGRAQRIFGEYPEAATELGTAMSELGRSLVNSRAS